MSTYTRTLESKLCEITQGFKAGVHDGIDLVNKGYTLGYISAHSGGIVVATRNNCNGFENGSYGNYVKIKHDNGMYTLYAHMSYNTVCVSVGQRVNEGDRLGYMGNTGYSFGGHLHFEVRNSNDSKIDPTPYLNAPLPSAGNEVNVYYCVKTIEHNWLPQVRNLEDYAGWGNSPITALAIKVDKGSIKYRVHIKNGDWYDYVTGYDINNSFNGFAGDGVNVIDLIEVYYYTPDNIRPYKKAKYRVNDLPYQYDNEKSTSMDGYAGIKGQAVTKFQIVIE